MPLSDRRFDSQIEEFLKNNPFKKYLDIGSGAGKYGKMIKKLFPNAQVIGIEAEKDYIKKYKTEKVYDQMINCRVEDFIKNNPSYTTDIAIMGDLLEHLFKSDGVDLIHYLIYRTKYMVIVFPSKFVMYNWRGHPTEAHNSVWNEEDFKQFDYRYFKNQIMNLVIIKGYWADEETVYNLNKST